MGLGGELKRRQECFRFSYRERGPGPPKLERGGKEGGGPEIRSACRTEDVFLGGSGAFRCIPSLCLDEMHLKVPGHFSSLPLWNREIAVS